jgi:hypothetical protein
MAEKPDEPESTDPNDSELLRDKLKGQTRNTPIRHGLRMRGNPAAEPS